MSEWVRFDEGGVRLRFSDCDVLKWDSHPSFAGGLGRTQSTRAVDFVVRSPEGRVVFFELKDFRDRRIENKGKLTSGQLAKQVAEKVRDSIAGLVWACERDGLADKTVHRVVHDLSRPRTDKILVVLWLDQDRSGHGPEAIELGRAIESHLRSHINAKVVVTSLRLRSRALPVDQFPWLEAESLPKSR